MQKRTLGIVGAAGKKLDEAAYLKFRELITRCNLSVDRVVSDSLDACSLTEPYGFEFEVCPTEAVISCADVLAFYWDRVGKEGREVIKLAYARPIRVFMSQCSGAATGVFSYEGPIPMPPLPDTPPKAARLAEIDTGGKILGNKTLYHDSLIEIGRAMRNPEVIAQMPRALSGRLTVPADDPAIRLALLLLSAAGPDFKHNDIFMPSSEIGTVDIFANEYAFFRDIILASVGE